MLHSFFSYTILVIYIQHSCIQGLPSPAAATNGHTDNEHEVEVIMLVSENNIPLGLLSCNSSPICLCIISFVIVFLITSSARVLCRWTTMRVLCLPSRHLLLSARFLSFLILLLSLLNPKTSRLR